MPYDQEFKQARLAILQAGKKVLQLYNKNFKIHYKAKNSPVTQADLASEKILLTALDKFNYGILSEETQEENSRLEKDKAWIIDPLDGTMDFIKKTSDFTIMVGLVDKSQPVLGLVYAPAYDHLYYARLSQGAFMQSGNNQPQPLRVSNRAKNNELRLLTSRFHHSKIEDGLAKALGIKQIRPSGSAGLKICVIANGQADININPSDKTWEWDTCAADIILREAGGKLTSLRDQPFAYNKKNPRHHHGYVATSGLTHNLIMDTLKKINHVQAILS